MSSRAGRLALTASCLGQPRAFYMRPRLRGEGEYEMEQLRGFDTSEIDHIPNVRRIENCPKDEMQALAMELTPAAYPHDEIYGAYCTLEEHVECPPELVYRYLADVETLAEWTHSLRDFAPAGDDGSDCHDPPRGHNLGEGQRVLARE